MAAIQEQPKLQLNFYSYGIVLRKQTDQEGFTEYAVDPEQLAHAVGIKQHLETGLLTPNTLYVGASATSRTIVEYRPPELTGIFLEGTEKPVRVPMPGMVMIRTVTGKYPTYGIFAVSERPVSMDAKLYLPPLPNMHSGGQVCWGNVRRVPKNALKSIELAQDWKLYLGSAFNNHAVQGKSKKHPKDVRLMLVEVENEGLPEYPVNDLTCDTTLDKFLGRLMNGVAR